MNIRCIKWFSLAALAAIALVAAAPEARADHGYGEVGLQVVLDRPSIPILHASTAPPRPYVEHRPSRPYGDWIWVDGYWHWTGYQWSWVSGRWVRDRPGYVYVEPYYRTTGSDCVYVSGYFAPRTRVRAMRRYVRTYRSTPQHRTYRRTPQHRTYYKRSSRVRRADSRYRPRVRRHNRVDRRHQRIDRRVDQRRRVKRAAPAKRRYNRGRSHEVRKRSKRSRGHFVGHRRGRGHDRRR